MGSEQSRETGSGSRKLEIDTKVKPATEKLPTRSFEEQIKSQIMFSMNNKKEKANALQGKTEQPKYKINKTSNNDLKMVNTSGSDFVNPFVHAVHVAFDEHYPLVLSPDMIWLCITQGLSQHISENSEKLRNKFVKHEGKEKIIVEEKGGKPKDDPDFDWKPVINDFSSELKKRLNEGVHDMILADFSTTGEVELIVSEIVLMESMKSYFEYECYTKCGIPYIVLKGSTNDWKKIREKAKGLAQYDLKWWLKDLTYVLDHFVSASEGRVDRKFWCSFYKLGGGSGGPYVTGWINTLFPYLKKGKNSCAQDWKKKMEYMFGGGPNPTDFNLGLSNVPFVWNYLGTKYDMNFIGGFVGVSQDEDTLELTPQLGYAITDEGLKKD